MKGALTLHKLESYIPSLVQAKEKLFSHQKEAENSNSSLFKRKRKFVIFISVTDTNSRALVFTGIGNTMESAWKNAEKKCLSSINKIDLIPKWIKIDLAINMELLTKHEFLHLYAKTKKNYFRKGVALDSQFNIAFLEQEFLANALLKNNSFSMKNINFYLQKYRNAKFPILDSYIKEIVIFDTISYFCDEINFYPLYSGGLNNGRRIVKDLDESLIKEVISQSSSYLAKQVKPSGEFTYGYFSHFYKEIKWYNMLRHASTIFSMIEAYTLTKEKDLELSIKRALEFLVKKGIVITEHSKYGTVAYVVDKKNNQEIKLGALGVALLTITKYTKVFEDEKYLSIAKSLGNGILSMQKEDGKFTHVLNAKDFSVKEDYRIVYYDGEALFGLIRLFELDKDQKWLEAALVTFDYFIKHDYWKNTDHWLSYCTNELTKYKQDDKYFDFGLKNAKYKLDFIYHRETTYPTFLELLMATDEMIDNIRNLQKDYLLKNYPVDDILQTINRRADHQLNGYFFPEVSMYMKFPKLVNGAFYIRHHSFRTRIDDIEHYISGYYHFYKKISQFYKIQP